MLMLQVITGVDEPPQEGQAHNTIAIHGFNYRAWHYKNYHVTKTGSHFVGQKGNQINRVSLVIQY